MRNDAVHRVLDAELAATRQRGVDSPRVLDVGGGSGVWAVPLAAAGCRVTVLEPNPNALATLRRRAAEEGVLDRITPVADDSDVLGTVVPAGEADLVLAHGLLEVVDDPAATVAALAAALAPGGALSVLVANRFAAVLHRAMAGDLGDALRLLRDPEGRAPDDVAPMRRRLDGDRLVELVAATGLRVETLQGDAVVSDLVPGSVLESGSEAVGSLAELELAAASTPGLRNVASRLHVLGRAAG
ncbi:methyltransferase family protein [Tamaricihabitans halophyticus]|uniref:Methyltransferase family protein n=1 Tax=Tamaricihabitans halophyticus TaxID=1262583 RepID=A0A4V2SR21_9PSEU|nr:class I SAM-dependent methyltransferase [Tamaricihabitans halophyticus]TCP41136.1 methyltransferase family protein [Tamaricihabitans halophyticus]